jgi:ribosome-associated protein
LRPAAAAHRYIDMKEFEQDPQDGEEETFRWVSKTRMKKEMHALQDLAVHLTTLNAEHLAQMPLSAEMLRAVEETKNIKKNEALRRHYQFLGKLIRSEDCDAIAAAVSGIKEEQDRLARLFHVMEQWRDDLIQGDQEVMERFFNEFPLADRQQLRHLVRSAKGAAGSQQATTHARKLFRFIRDSVAGRNAD